MSEQRFRPTVELDAYRDADRALLGRLLGDPRMMRHLGGPESAEALDRRHRRYLAADPTTNGLYTVVLQPGSARVGWVGFWEHEWGGSAEWECGWHLLPESQGRGVMGEADVEYPKGHMMRAAHWRLDLEAL